MLWIFFLVDRCFALDIYVIKGWPISLCSASGEQNVHSDIYLVDHIVHLEMEFNYKHKLNRYSISSFIKNATIQKCVIETVTVSNFDLFCLKTCFKEECWFFSKCFGKICHMRETILPN